MTQDHYDELVKRLGFPGSRRLKAVMEHMMTPRQSAMVEALPGTAEDVAARTGFEPEEVRESLEELFFKGAVFPRGDFENRDEYRFARSIVQLHDAAQATQHLDPVKDRHFFELWQNFCDEEMYPVLARGATTAKQGFARIIPAYKSIQDLPDIQPWENFRELLQAQALIAVTPCSCRLRTYAVGNPCEYTDEVKRWNCIQFGRGAEYVIARGSGKSITLEEALELADQVEEDGLLHIGSYHRSMQMNTSCQCCYDCCEFIVAMVNNDVPVEKAYARSRYEALVNEDKCDGCQDCLERCQFDAIDLVRSGKRYKAVVDPEKCWGCGVCVLKCDTGAIRMQAVRPPDFVPEAPL